jgi:hypothetical protein
VVCEKVVLLATGAVDDRHDTAGEVVDGFSGVVAVPESLCATRTHVRADASVKIERPVPTTVDADSLDHPLAAADDFDIVGPAVGVLLIGLLGRHGRQLMARSSRNAFVS